MIPKYETIAADIQRSIEDGALKPGDKLPTVVEICDIYSVSKITVNRALERLTEMGLVSTRRGSGTYVKGSPAVEPDSRFFRAYSDRAGGFSAEHKDQKVESEIFEFSVINPPAKIAEQLSLSEDDFVYFIVRMRKADNVPIVIEYTYMPIELIPGLKKNDLYGSIYQYINNNAAHKISSFHRTIRAVGANKEESERLKTALGAPLLEFEQVGFLDSGEPFEYSVSRNVGDRYELYNVTLA